MPPQRHLPVLRREQQQIVDPGQDPPAHLRAVHRGRPDLGQPQVHQIRPARNVLHQPHHTPAIAVDDRPERPPHHRRQNLHDPVQALHGGGRIVHRRRQGPQRDVRQLAQPEPEILVKGALHAHRHGVPQRPPRRRRPAVHREHRRTRQHEVPDPRNQPQHHPLPPRHPHQPCHMHVQEDPRPPRVRHTVRLGRQGGPLLPDLPTGALPRQHPQRLPGDPVDHRPHLHQPQGGRHIRDEQDQAERHQHHRQQALHAPAPR